MDWLDEYMDPLETPYDYQPFYDTVTAVVMGRKTYEKALSFGEYPYKGKPGLVLSRDENFVVDERGVEVASDNWLTQVSTLSSSMNGRLWLVGGGEIANVFVNHNILDEIVLTIIPETIGTGIGWLGNAKLSAGWKLSEHHTSKKGVVQLVYLTR